MMLLRMVIMTLMSNRLAMAASMRVAMLAMVVHMILLDRQLIICTGDSVFTHLLCVRVSMGVIRMRVTVMTVAVTMVMTMPMSVVMAVRMTMVMMASSRPHSK